MLSVQDKVNGVHSDFTAAPVKKSVLALSYYASTVLTTLIVCTAALIVCLVYLHNVGWYLSLKDILLTCLDVFLLVMFGTALSSVVNFFLSTQGQMSAVGTIVGAGYGFICGAYMPISEFSEGIQRFVSFLPGTYGTALLHNHLMRGVFNELENGYFPKELVDGIRESFDSTLYFSGSAITVPQMYAVTAGAVTVLIAAYILLNMFNKQLRKAV